VTARVLTEPIFAKMQLTNYSLNPKQRKI